MSILKIARMGHPVLRQPARVLKAADIQSRTLQKLVEDMLETMREYHGVGLAAPQVHESVRLFVADLSDPPDREDGERTLVALFNPEISPVGIAMVEDWEGCLSIPDLRGKVPRAPDVRVRALDRKAKPFELTLHGFPARVVQHETDHLDGVLFVDRMKSFETLTFLDEFARFWDDE